jgi:hypothetical protein
MSSSHAEVEPGESGFSSPAIASGRAAEQYDKRILGDHHP